MSDAFSSSEPVYSSCALRAASAASRAAIARRRARSGRSGTAIPHASASRATILAHSASRRARAAASSSTRPSALAICPASARSRIIASRPAFVSSTRAAAAGPPRLYAATPSRNSAIRA